MHSPRSTLDSCALWRWRRRVNWNNAPKPGGRGGVTQRCTCGEARGKACRRKENRRFFGKSKRRPLQVLFLPRSVFWQCDRLSRPQIGFTKNQEIAMGLEQERGRPRSINLHLMRARLLPI